MKDIHNYLPIYNKICNEETRDYRYGSYGSKRS